jgi:hypothetical protein
VAIAPIVATAGRSGQLLDMAGLLRIRRILKPGYRISGTVEHANASVIAVRVRVSSDRREDDGTAADDRDS